MRDFRAMVPRLAIPVLALMFLSPFAGDNTRAPKKQKPLEQSPEPDQKQNPKAPPGAKTLPANNVQVKKKLHKKKNEIPLLPAKPHKKDQNLPEPNDLPMPVAVERVANTSNSGRLRPVPLDQDEAKAKEIEDNIKALSHRLPNGNISFKFAKVTVQLSNYNDLINSMPYGPKKIELFNRFAGLVCNYIGRSNGDPKVVRKYYEITLKTARAMGREAGELGLALLMRGQKDTNTGNYTQLYLEQRD